MADELSIASLRAAIRGGERPGGDDDERFEALARRYERAVAQLVGEIHRFLGQIPELSARLEDEEEEFTSPAFPGKTLRIRDQRLRVTNGDDFVLFDPTARALLSALGQVEVEASRPLPFMIEKVLYLIPQGDGSTARWGFRSATAPGGPLIPFDGQALLKLLHAVFAAP